MTKTIASKNSEINVSQQLVQFEYNIASTLNEVSFGDWEDVLEELSDSNIIKSVLNARKEYKEGNAIPYKKIKKK